MKIVYITSTSFADSDFPLIRQYQQMGHDVYVFIDLPCYALRSSIIDIKHQIQRNAIFAASEYEEFNVYGKYIDLKKVYVVNRLNKSIKHPKNWLLWCKVAQHIYKINPDIIHQIGGLGELSSILLLFRKKLVVTIHDPFPHTGEQTRRREFMRKFTMKYCKKFILLNAQQKELFIKTYEIDHEKVLVNKMGQFDYLKLFSHKLETDRTTKNILFFGRISPYKGVEYLLQAMLKVHDVIPEVTLTIAGGGKMYFDIEPYMKLDYVKIQNRYIGTEEIVALLEQCDVTVCPYTDATQSGVVLTAFSVGVPVIASNVGALGETIDDGKTGMLIPSKDVDALADTLTKVLSDNSLLNDMRKNIAENFHKQGGWNNIAEKNIAFYKMKIN